MDDFDLVVIGGGAGGMAAARAGVRRKARTLLVQDGRIGGDCTFTGCVPSKAVIAAARRGESFHQAMAHAHRAIEAVAATEDDEVFAKEGVRVLHGRATFRRAGEITVDGSPIRSAKFILATGARPIIPTTDGLADVEFLTSESVFNLAAPPRCLVILGGGPIGVELAQAFRRLGSEVTLIEAGSRLLSKEEPEASSTVGEAFEAEGIRVRLGNRAVRVEALSPGQLRVHLADGPPVEGDRLLVALGRRPVTAELGLEAVGIETDERGHVRTDDRLATAAPNVWAVGDVTGKLPFTHAADEMGRIAAGNALSRLPSRRFRTSWIPWVTFTDPEIGRVGLTEAQAAGRRARVAFLPMTAVDRAVAEDETRGFVKLVVGPRPVLGNVAGGSILGATVVAARGGEVVHEAALAMRARMFPARLAQTVRAYPTWSTAMQAAAAQLFIEVDGRRARRAER